MVSGLPSTDRFMFGYARYCIRSIVLHVPLVGKQKLKNCGPLPYQRQQCRKCSKIEKLFSLKLLSPKVRSVINLPQLLQVSHFLHVQCFRIPPRNTYVTISDQVRDKAAKRVRAPETREQTLHRQEQNRTHMISRPEFNDSLVV